MAVEGGKAQQNGGKTGNNRVVKEDVMFGKVDFGTTENSKKRKGPTDVASQIKQVWICFYSRSFPA